MCLWKGNILPIQLFFSAIYSTRLTEADKQTNNQHQVDTIFFGTKSNRHNFKNEHNPKQGLNCICVNIGFI